MRHGQAESLAGRDRDRALTHEGRRETLIMADRVAEIIGNSAHAMVSPYLRAQQTFEIVNQLLCLPAARIESSNDLTPHGCADEVADLIFAVAEDAAFSSLLLVSHMPLVSFLVEALDRKHSAPMFAPSSVAHLVLDFERRDATLISLESPHTQF